MQFTLADGQTVTFLLDGLGQELVVTVKETGFKPIVKNFRQLYKMLLSVNKENTHNMTDEEVNALIADEKSHQLTMKVTMRDGNELKYEVYNYSDRRSYYRINGKADIRALCWALNGYDTKTGKLLPNYTVLQADGSTACGIWIFSGYYNNNDAPMDPMKQPMTRRSKADPTGLGLFPQWSYAWPANRRILYNRASADPQGRPWNKDRVLVEWKDGKWLQNDVGDFATAQKPNNDAFFMTWEQNARLFAAGMVDGPMPEHFEPHEAPIKNLLNGAGGNPCAFGVDDPSVQRGDVSEFPFVVTTYSVVEHWQSGTQTRNIPWLNEISPCNFIELSEELAKEKGIKNGDMVRVWNKRGNVKVAAMVTKRMKPMTIDGKTVHVVGMPHHFSWAGQFATGDNVNDLPPNVGDPNSYIPEYKAFLVNLEKA
jgi:formate dehydrogenase major subunit